MCTLFSKEGRGDLPPGGFENIGNVKPFFLKSTWVIFLFGVLLMFHSGSFAQGKSFDIYKKVLWSHIEKICSFGPRNQGSEGHQKARDYIKKAAAYYADRWRAQNFQVQVSSMRQLQMQNIEMIFNGRENTAPILIGAHYDTRPFADEEEDETLRDKPILGANDGGSGTALLLALAQYLKEHKPKRPVHLVFFDGEDYGVKGSDEYFFGSRFYARELLGKDKSLWPYCVLVVDMVGDKDLNILKENYSAKSAPWLLDIVYEAAKDQKVPQFVSKFGYSIRDDHLPFAQIGIPSAVLIDFDYPHWHTAHDTLDKVSAESLEAVFKVVVETLERL